jgi:hypothetical protein
MKKRYLFLTAMLLTTLIYSCKKNAVQVITTNVDLANSAQIKFFNFSASSPSMNFYANGTKISAIASGTGAESTTGTAFGAVFPASNYSVLPGGAYTFKGQIPSTATADANLAVLTIPGTIDNTKYYTLYASGIYNATTKTADSFILEDKLPALNLNVAYVRFVNCISNAPQTFSFYVRNTTITPNVETLISASVAYKAGSDFVAVPAGTYELYVRYASAPTVNVISRNGTTNGAVSFAASKIYTIGAKGDMTVVSTTATNRPLLDNTANR